MQLSTWRKIKIQHFVSTGTAILVDWWFFFIQNIDPSFKSFMFPMQENVTWLKQKHLLRVEP